MFQKIESLQNARIKHLLRLQEKSRVRKKDGLFLIEGVQELDLAIQGGYDIDSLFFCNKVIGKLELQNILDLLPEAEKLEISLEIYQKLSYRSSTEGVVAIGKVKDHSLSALSILKKNALILVAEAPEKPGNIGALLRTADAAGVSVVCIANPKTDLYNPNIIRSSVGCVFTTTIVTGSTTEIIGYLKQQEVNIYCSALQASVEYTNPDYCAASAIVVGTESTGLSEEWLNVATQNIKIPMNGRVDSMNVSVAAGILLFEAVRQRSL